MGWYGAWLLPRLLNRAMDTADLREARVRVAAGLTGEVVEIGFGSGHNLPYVPAQVTRLIGVDPSETSQRLAAGRIASAAFPVEVLTGGAERLPLPDASVDAALCTWTLCSVSDPLAAVREVCRVLRRGGQLHFVEHGRAPDASVRKWQARLNPLQRRFVGGCTLDRDIPGLLELGGLTVTRLATYYVPREPKVLAATYEGLAVPR